MPALVPTLRALLESFAVRVAAEIKLLAYLSKNNTFTGVNAFSGGEIDLTNGTSNLVDFAAAGQSAPAAGATAPVGQKVTLYRLRSASASDYAIGVAANEQWYSTPIGNTSAVHRFYVNGSQRLTVTNSSVSVTGSLAVSSFTQSQTYINGSNTRTADLPVTASSTSASNLMDCSAAARAVTLYSSANPGQRFTITKTDSTANACTVSVASGGTILTTRGALSSLVLGAQGDSIEVESTATAGVWLLLNDERRERQLGILNVSSASKLGGYTSAGGDYNVGGVVNKYVEITASGKTVTLPSASLFGGFDYYIVNSSTGPITVTGATSAQTIGNTASAAQTYQVPAGVTLHVISNGTVWRIL